MKPPKEPSEIPYHKLQEEKSEDEEEEDSTSDSETDDSETSDPADPEYKPREKRKSQWPSTIAQFFPIKINDERLNRANNLFQMFRSDQQGIPPVGKQNIKKLEALKEEMGKKPEMEIKEQWLANSILKLCPDKKHGNSKKEKDKNPPPPGESSPSSSSGTSVAMTGVNFANTVSSFPSLSKKRKREESPKTESEGKVGVTFPIGKSFFKDFKVVAHKKIPTKKISKDCIESVLDTKFYSIDVDTFILIVKKEWGAQDTEHPGRFYLRFGRNYRKKGSDQDDSYTFDYPLHMIDVLNIQLKKCLSDFQKQKPTWFSDMEAFRNKKLEK